jgi:superfamily II DNA or RNA helicase
MEAKDLVPGAVVSGLTPRGNGSVIAVQWVGQETADVTYQDDQGRRDGRLVFASDLAGMNLVKGGRHWSFDADGALLRLVSEAKRIRLAHLFDPYLAVQTSNVEPLPHQITAVYETLLPRQPLRFLLADDPGAGKTVMAGLFIKELLVRGDLKRCLIVCPGVLVEQWQDELSSKFQLPFEILTNDKMEAARTGNWFQENDLVICRLDKLSRDEDAQKKLEATDWDLIVVDEAHKMSAHYFGNEVKRTRRYELGLKLSHLTRHFLMMTATPHSGKPEDFQLFMALIDQDRFEGKPRDGVQKADVRDLMCRRVKEDLLRFDGTRLFPERKAYTIHYNLTDAEAALYNNVSRYVQEEFNRAEALENEGRKGTVGFALTVLQRRLASSPEAIYQSLRRRKERLGQRLRDLRMAARGEKTDFLSNLRQLDEEALEDLEDSPDAEVEAVEEELVDKATAARTSQELEAEIEILALLEKQADTLRRAGTDTKWDELRRLLEDNPLLITSEGHRRKLILFTEHRDTLNYIQGRLGKMLGPSAIVAIHGGMGREERKKNQDAFTHDKDVQILLATDAAGEGINLQRAHLVVNYDLPWNPNRIEQRFGRVHRIGQKEVCHLWNMVARETREGYVFDTILEKLQHERDELGGAVFDVLGSVFEGVELRKLLIEAVRYGERPDVKQRLTEVVQGKLDRGHLKDLIEQRALTTEAMDASAVFRIKEDMEKAEARKLQPHFIGEFFLAAFERLGGTIHRREEGRYEITRVPGRILDRARMLGTGRIAQPRYERVTFEKHLVSVQGKPLAEFITPGHPLLDATAWVLLEDYGSVLKQGAVLVDPTDGGQDVRALAYLEHAINDGRRNKDGSQRLVSQELQFVEINGIGDVKSAGYAPYLDYRPVTEEEQNALAGALEEIVKRGNWEEKARQYAIRHLVPEHMERVSKQRLERIEKTRKQVKQRLTREINYQTVVVNDQELKIKSGKAPAMNLDRARHRLEDLERRLETRLRELDEEKHLNAAPPHMVGGALVVPVGLLAKLGVSEPESAFALETKEIEMAAVNAVMQAERELGFHPEDVGLHKRGWDIESVKREMDKPTTLRLIEVKGRRKGGKEIVVTKNEIIHSLNKTDAYILAIVEVDGKNTKVHYVRKPFNAKPDFGATSVIYQIQSFADRWEDPR